MTEGIFKGTRSDVREIPDALFPRGPIGAKGTLETGFVDDDLRIAQGPNVYNNTVDTFVLKRVVEDPVLND